MAEVEIADVLAEAQAALEANRPQEAIATCQYARQHFPDSITALRLLGEAYLEVGRPDDASRAFEAVLQSDPFNVLARIGLAVIAEERGEDERALAQFRLAWEVDPLLPQIRGELVRLYRKRYGPGGHLRMTRPALAMLHTRNLDFVRAIKEYRSLVQEQPERPELTLALSEVLWRRGDDWQARVLCERLLVTNPRLARMLYILADITSSQGGDALAYLATARQVDPNAEIARTLHAARPSTVLASYIGEAVRVRAFDPSASPTWDTPPPPAARDGGSTAPLTWESIAASWSDELAPTTGAPDPGAAPEGATLFPDLERERTGEASARREDTATVQPFNWSPEPVERPEDGGREATSGEAPSQVPAGAMAHQPDEPDAVARLTADWGRIDDELEAATPPREPAELAPDALDVPDDTGTIPFRLDQFAAPPSGSSAANALAADEPRPGRETAPADGPEPFRPDGIGAGRGAASPSFSELLRQSNAPATPPPTAASSAPSALAGDATPREDESEPAGEPPVASASGAVPDGENQEPVNAGQSGTGVVELEQPSTPEPDAREGERSDIELASEPVEGPSSGPPVEPAAEPPAPEELYGSLPASHSDATDRIPVSAEQDELPSWLRGDLFAAGESGESESPEPAADVTPAEEPAPQATAPAEQLGTPPAEPQTATAMDSAEDVRDAGDAITDRLPALPDQPELSEAPAPRAADESLIGVAPMSTWRADWNAPEPDSAPPPATDEPERTSGEPQAAPEGARAQFGAPAAGAEEGAAAPETAPPGYLDAPAPSDALPGTARPGVQETRDEAPDDRPEPAVTRASDEDAGPEGTATPDELLAAYRRQVKEADTVPQEVVVALREMIAAGIGGARVHRVLGEAYLKQGQYDLASAELQQALRARFPR